MNNSGDIGVNFIAELDSENLRCICIFRLCGGRRSLSCRCGISLRGILGSIHGCALFLGFGSELLRYIGIGFCILCDFLDFIIRSFFDYFRILRNFSIILGFVSRNKTCSSSSLLLYLRS